jgi:hypothetical protein
LLSGKEGKMNGEIVRYLSLSGPSVIYHVAKELSLTSQTKIHYPTVNRRVHDLVARGYLKVAGTRRTKSGAEAALYATTIRGDFGSLASGLNERQEYKLVQLAGTKPGSPFLLLKHMLDRGLPFELVRREFVTGLRDDLRNGYINIEALNEEVVCSAFATSMARKLREVMGEGGREYVEQAVRILESLATPAKTQSPSPVAAFGATHGGTGAGRGALGSISGPQVTQDYSITQMRVEKPKRGWIPELRQLLEDML